MSENFAVEDYYEVLNAFLNLKGQGVTPTQEDVNILLGWSKSQVDPNYLMTVIVDLCLNNKKEDSPKPRSLSDINTIIQKLKKR